jgi:hypothetical protein
MALESCRGSRTQQDLVKFLRDAIPDFLEEEKKTEEIVDG